MPEAEIAIAAVNGEVVALTGARVRDTDRVDLYPPISGGSGGGRSMRPAPGGR